MNKMYISRNLISGAVKSCDPDYEGESGLWSPVITIVDHAPQVKSFRVMLQNHPGFYLCVRENSPHFGEGDVTNATLILDEGVDL